MKAVDYNALAANTTCLICGAPELSTPQINAEHGLWKIDCTNCGIYRIDESAIADLVQTWRPNKPNHMAMISYRIRRMQGKKPPYISATWLHEACETDLEFPHAFEQVENLIIFMAKNLGPGEEMNLSARTCQAAVGASDGYVLGWVIQQAEGQGWIEGISRVASSVPYEILNGYLTLAGWEWYNEIGRHKRSRAAFMAMQYGDEQLTRIVDQHFKPAVAQAGFELRLLVDAPKAGIIDNRLRVEIRRSRLVIADLSHHNNGAYWEAGFGEGLGLPVIYTCKNSVLAEKENRKVHFDARNSLIVPWSSDDPSKAAEELKATIRNTLPEEAILEDDI